MRHNVHSRRQVRLTVPESVRLTGEVHGTSSACKMPSDGMLRRVSLVRTDVLLRSVRRLLFKADVVPTSAILVTLMMEALSSSETSVPTRATRRNIPEDDILHSHRHENLKSYKALTGWTL
jgi:hypothetical protein